MSGDDIIHGEMDSLAMGISLRSKISREQAYCILTNIGFYEERYGAKPMVMDKIVSLSNAGCSYERIFAAIKLLPGQANRETALGLPVDTVNMAAKVLAGEAESPDTFAVMKRAVDL